MEEVPRLDVNGPDGLPAALEGLVADALGRDDLTLHLVEGGAGTGQSGAPVFLVKNESGGLAAVAKVFPAVEELVRELSAINRLGDAEFTRFRAPDVLGVAVAHLPTGAEGALVMSVAPGRSLFDMIGDLPPRESPDRPAAFAELRQAVQESAMALAELHSRPDGSGGPVDRGFLEFNHRLAQPETAAVAAHGDTLRAFEIEGDALTARVDEIVRAALAEPGGAAIMHGDAHPGNVFWHSTEGVTLIDTPHSHFSMDASGGAIGTPARDFSNMVQRLAHFSQEAGLSTTEIANLQAAFVDTYRAEGGPIIPEAARTAFAARFAMRDVLDTLTPSRNQISRPNTVKF